MTRNSLIARLMVASASFALLAACGQQESATAPETTSSETSAPAAEVASTNPLLKDWDTPYGIPPFAEIDDSHYMPAFDQGIAELEAEAAAIETNPEVPTFANTIEAMERAGETLSRVSGVFFNVTNTDTNDTLNALEVEISPRLSQVYDSISLNDAIWQRVKTLYETRDTLGLDGEQMRVLELYHRDFVRRGAALDADDKARMKEINAEISKLTTQFGQNLLAETKNFELVITDEADLAGLSDAFIAAGKKAAENKGQPNAWIFGLNRSVYEGFMTASENRELRKKLFDGYTLRAANGGEADNGDIILQIARLRAEAARIRGYKNHAEFQLETRMAKTPENAEQFLLQVWRPGLARAKQELADMQALVGDAYTVESHDWWHLAEKVRQEKYAFDDNQLKPYFELSNVQDGAFYMAEKLFGVTFTKLDDTPKWNPEVTVYDMKDADGSHLGIFMVDMFARDSKRGGAWMSSYRSATSMDEVVRPIITNNMNLTKPADGAPALMSFGDVETLFHEFGHGLHGLMTTQKYDRISGVSGPRDYTEFPAQILEHWASQPQMLEQFATHYETGEVIPAELVEKMKNAATFNQGFKTTEFIAASLLDLRWHMLTEEEAAEVTDAREFEQKVLAEYGLIDEIEPRYRSQYFAHIFAGGYSAGYYAYLWSEILDADGFAAFEEAGDIFDPTLAKRLRTHVYEAGGIEEADVLYRKFRGKDPDIGPLLKKRGFEDGS
jgi:peptidyl-dipeptidase Dcp